MAQILCYVRENRSWQQGTFQISRKNEQRNQKLILLMEVMYKIVQKFTTEKWPKFKCLQTALEGKFWKFDKQY